MRIAIQGGRASFHDMAVRRYFCEQEPELIACRTFREQFTGLRAGAVDYVVMAIENTLAGSLLPNYSLLEEFEARVVGEVYLHIQQDLMALPGQSLSEIRTVRSHPIALQQCSGFMENHPHLRSVETHDTADSAREIRESAISGAAAIAGNLAAEVYELEILAAGIQNIADNYTRFWVISRNGQDEQTQTANKASLSFHVRHEVGALANVLDIFRDNGVSLGLIQSVPIPGRPDEYAFHVDVESFARADFERALTRVKKITSHFHILGEYQSGVKPYDRASS